MTSSPLMSPLNLSLPGMNAMVPEDVADDHRYTTKRGDFLRRARQIDLHTAVDRVPGAEFVNGAAIHGNHRAAVRILFREPECLDVWIPVVARSCAHGDGRKVLCEMRLI